MAEFFSYGAVFLWLLLAVLTFLIGRKQGAAGYLLSLFFLFMTVWYGLKAFFKLPMFDGVLSFVFRGILLVFLAVIILVWYRGRVNRAQSDPASTAHAEDCTCDQCRQSNEEKLHID